jgi:hypothetical protein
LALLLDLNKKAEIDRLSDHEIDLKHYLKERLVLLLREEEIKWYERAKVKTLLEGVGVLDRQPTKGSTRSR